MVMFRAFFVRGLGGLPWSIDEGIPNKPWAMAPHLDHVSLEVPWQSLRNRVQISVSWWISSMAKVMVQTNGSVGKSPETKGTFGCEIWGFPGPKKTIHFPNMTFSTKKMGNTQ